MEFDSIYSPSFQGTKKFDQHQVRHTNATGFGAGADDYAGKTLDLNELLVRNKAATFFLRVRGEAMENAGIHDGDLVVVDRSVKVQSGKIVIAVLNGEMLIRRFEKNFNRMRLIPETTRLAPIDIDPGCEEFSIWGVVVWTIHGV